MGHGLSQGRIFKLILLTKLGDMLGAWNHEVKENSFKSKSLKMSIVDSVGTMHCNDTSKSTCVWTVSDPLQIVRLSKSRMPR